MLYFSCFALFRVRSIKFADPRKIKCDDSASGRERDGVAKNSPCMSVYVDTNLANQLNS